MARESSGGDDETWAAAWLERVASGAATMSQRKIGSVESHGGVAAATRVAKRVGVHLAVFVDDTGAELVAASKHPIRVLC